MGRFVSTRRLHTRHDPRRPGPRRPARRAGLSSRGREAMGGLRFHRRIQTRRAALSSSGSFADDAPLRHWHPPERILAKYRDKAPRSKSPSTGRCASGSTKPAEQFARFPSRSRKLAAGFLVIFPSPTTAGSRIHRADRHALRSETIALRRRAQGPPSWCAGRARSAPRSTRLSRSRPGAHDSQGRRPESAGGDEGLNLLDEQAIAERPAIFGRSSLARSTFTSRAGAFHFSLDRRGRLEADRAVNVFPMEPSTLGVAVTRPEYLPEPRRGGSRNSRPARFLVDGTTWPARFPSHATPRARAR